MDPKLSLFYNFLSLLASSVRSNCTFQDFKETFCTISSTKLFVEWIQNHLTSWLFNLYWFLSFNTRSQTNITITWQRLCLMDRIKRIIFLYLGKVKDTYLRLNSLNPVGQLPWSVESDGVVLLFGFFQLCIVGAGIMLLCTRVLRLCQKWTMKT